jgi:hypothetical protein
MHQAELQQDIERFTALFIERIAQAMEELEESDRPLVRTPALRKHILYASSALDIVSGSLPEVDLLDMLVFVRLSRVVLEEHWIPELYGDEGRDLVEAFQRSESELWQIADKLMNESQKRDLMALIDDWRAENPKQVRVEGIRLLDFSQRAGKVATERDKQTQGLLSSVKLATRTADQALLLGERAMFLIHRLPSVMRLQARLACREIVADVVTPLVHGRTWADASERTGALLRRGLAYVVLAGGALSLSWWGGYFLAHRKLRRGR